MRALGGRRRDQTILILVVAIPVVVWYIIFVGYPIVTAIHGSLTAWKGLYVEKPFVGLANYIYAFKDPVFRISLSNTIFYTVMNVPAHAVTGLILALAIHASARLKPLFRTTYFIPVVTATIATALVWKYLYQPQVGLFNAVLRVLHLPTSRWLLDLHLALPSIVLYATWKGVGFQMIILLSALENIDQTFYDAARVDGSSEWQLFWRITLPLLQPTLLLIIVTGVIWSLKAFGPIYVMSATTSSSIGGPVHATRVLTLYQYTTAFRELNMGYGLAMAFILFAIILVVTIIQLRVLRTRWEY